MFTVTDSASAMLAQLLQQAEGEDANVFRLGRSGEDFGLMLDQERDGDEVFHRDEQPVLVVEKDVHDQLAEAAMDVAETPEGPQLRLLPAGETGQQA